MTSAISPLAAQLQPSQAISALQLGTEQEITARRGPWSLKAQALVGGTFLCYRI